jgi:uncharacterized protein HemX
MDASVWISLAALGVTVGGGAVGYGMLRQQVASLKETVVQDSDDEKVALAQAEARQTEALTRQTEALTKVEARHAEALTKVEGRVTACEAGHANTAQEMNALRVDVAILTERSGATITSLDRIERHLSDRPQTPARRRVSPK